MQPDARANPLTSRDRMTLWTVQAGTWLLQTATAMPDPIVQQVGAAGPAWFVRVASVAACA